MVAGHGLLSISQAPSPTAIASKVMNNEPCCVNETRNLLYICILGVFVGNHIDATVIIIALPFPYIGKYLKG